MNLIRLLLLQTVFEYNIKAASAASE
jgi:hypothetical protein